MRKQANNLMDGVLGRILDDYGMSVKSGRDLVKKAEECQDGVSSELRNEDSGKDVDEDSVFAPEKKMYKEDGSTEGGNWISDGKKELPETPSGEQPTFDNYMTGDSEGGTASTKKTNTDPGYQEGASVSGDLSISGSTVDKGAAFIKMAQAFVPAHEAFLEKLAGMVHYVNKTANPMMDPAAMGGDPAAMGGDPSAMMDPNAAMAGMGGPGQGGEEEGIDMSEGELDPADAALVESLIQTQTGENPLSDEEVAQIQAILDNADGGGEAAMDPAAMGMDPAAMGGDPAMAGGAPPMDPSMAPMEGKVAYDRNAIMAWGQQVDREHAFAQDKLASVGEPALSEGELQYVEGILKQACGDEDFDPECEYDDDDDDIDAQLDQLSPEELQALIAEIEAEEGGGELEAEGLDDGCGIDEETLMELISQLPEEEAAAVIMELLDGDEGLDDACAESGEPDLDDNELNALAEVALDEEGYGPEAYGNSDEYKEASAQDEKARLFKKEAKLQKKYAKLQTKMAALQPKNAAQARKAQRYGQVIDSLIRKK